MVQIVGVRFRRAGRIHYYDAGPLVLGTGDVVIVETARGLDAARVVIAPRPVALAAGEAAPRPVVRQAAAGDLAALDRYQFRADEALRRARERVAAHNLPMKLVRAEYNFDGSRVTFQFVAEGRVDFRALVRDLASTFRTRIELRQITDREQAGVVGALGRCGRELCCSGWLHDLPTPTIRMAKDQALPISPSRITGACGRLLCCLSYEHDSYAAAKRELPRLGQTVTLPDGPGRVVAVRPLDHAYEVELPSGSQTTVTLAPGSAPLVGDCATCRHATPAD